MPCILTAQFISGVRADSMPAHKEGGERMVWLRLGRPGDVAIEFKLSEARTAVAALQDAIARAEED